MRDAVASLGAKMIPALRFLVVTTVFAHAILVCAQPFLAGWSLDGDGTALDLHGGNGGIVVTLSLLLIVLGIPWWRPGGGSGRVPILATLLFAAETLQLNLGHADILVGHVPLGVGIVVTSLLLCAVSIRGSPSRPLGPACERNQS
ncbi:hypothetical protein B1813_15285 [Saccharomonospora piscinae]|uniref:Integral membrane protein n=1 Tax=Saccharomonospora piscinae TaxID=687388 RepID=A0A1V9A1F5_SACPI|nr:hypothetical protein [Saccharomonospora piscinae]OQO90880.1 hypothetical protein B1813_15285 [Saccharomonospora piscinae]